MMSQKHSFSERIWQIITNLSALPRDVEHLAKKKTEPSFPQFFAGVMAFMEKEEDCIISCSKNEMCSFYKVGYSFQNLVVLYFAAVPTFTIPCNVVNAERVRPKGPRAKIQFLHAIPHYQKKSSFHGNRMQKNMHTLFLAASQKGNFSMMPGCQGVRNCCNLPTMVGG